MGTPNFSAFPTIIPVNFGIDNTYFENLGYVLEENSFDYDLVHNEYVELKHKVQSAVEAIKNDLEPITLTLHVEPGYYEGFQAYVKHDILGNKEDENITWEFWMKNLDIEDIDELLSSKSPIFQNDAEIKTIYETIKTHIDNGTWSKAAMLDCLKKLRVIELKICQTKFSEFAEEYGLGKVVGQTWTSHIRYEVETIVPA